MGALFDKKVIWINIGILLVFIFFFSEKEETFPFAYRDAISTTFWFILLAFFYTSM